MEDRILVRTGIAGAFVAALCCVTPFLAVGLGAVGLAAWAAKADYVLIQVLVASMGLIVIELHRRNTSKSPAASPSCDANDDTRKLKP